ncbi:hypothetical protein LTR08_002143 [Meristemomyces frigidus]|nr:hypothetical protein LTR08_002143 [Meristemomyces frigidus]
MGRRDGGGMLSGLIGMAAEYHEHRKQKPSGGSNRQDEDFDAEPQQWPRGAYFPPGPSSSPSTAPQQVQRGVYASPRAVRSPPGAAYSPAGEALPPGIPPSYAELDGGSTGGRQLTRSAFATDEKRQSGYGNEKRATSYENDGDCERDEEDWELDEALDSPANDRNPPSYNDSEVEVRTNQQLVEDVLRTDVSNPYGQMEMAPLQPLRCPVIIPQRRPGVKRRGFVRAYAPALAGSRIDQATFLDFLKFFHESSQASPIFDVIQVSAGIAGFAPGAIAMVVTTLAQVGAKAGKEIQTRQRTNNFLDDINERMFKPKGLYAFIMKYKANDDSSGLGARFGLVKSQAVDMSTNQVIAKYNGGPSAGAGTSDRMRNMRAASGQTVGACQLPESSPLIFPAIDAAVARNGVDATFKDKAKDAQKFLAGYLDRRAQAQYARDDPNSSLVIPEENRANKSKLADRNHPMYNGGLVGLVSGGALTPMMDKRGQQQSNGRSDRRQRKDERKMAKYERSMDSGRALGGNKQKRYDGILGRMQNRDGNGKSSDSDSDSDSDRQRGTRGAGFSDRGRSRGQNARDGKKKVGAIGAVKRSMKEDVLYLMIVNLPSDAELAEARGQLAGSQTQQRPPQQVGYQQGGPGYQQDQEGQYGGYREDNQNQQGQGRGGGYDRY